ncbi:hypothetical protein OSB04_005819 [Centaurea solstitialis]|uniref:Uncharacterized protein n=1 Tax=Centaurea solstitialis TaxID=347529 RepID=A0AA38WRN6_9ASTR|nr:hypothetical protein OSB04_005819 [Centaurea solstitialis]
MMISDQSRRKNSPPVTSRYLSPSSPAAEPPSLLPPSPTHNDQQKPKSSSKLLRGVWPSSSKSHNQNSLTATTLADYLGNDRKRDTHLSKQKSCSEFSRFENIQQRNKTTPRRIRSRFLEFRFTGRSSTSSSTKSSEFLDSGSSLGIVPGRLSVDENELRRRSYSARMRSDSFSDDSECSDLGRNSPASSYMAPTLLSARKSVSSKYMSPSLPIANSPTKSTVKNAMKKANSIAVLPSKWGSSPAGRPESPPTPTSSSFSRSKPPTSPSRSGKRNLLHMGLDLIKLKKSSSRSGCLSPLGSGTGTDMDIHQVRMMHRSLMQWRYANARANLVNETLDDKAKKDSLHVLENITKLQQSVLQQRLQLEKEKLELKLNFVVRSQMKMLEVWRDMERKHTWNVSVIKDCLEVVACRVPLIDGAKMDSQTTSLALRHATDLVASVMSMTSPLTPTTSETMSTSSELAKIANEEKLLLEECIEHFRVISTLEIQERSLRCAIIEMISSEDQHQIPYSSQYFYYGEKKGRCFPFYPKSCFINYVFGWKPDQIFNK